MTAPIPHRMTLLDRTNHRGAVVSPATFVTMNASGMGAGFVLINEVWNKCLRYSHSALTLLVASPSRGGNNEALALLSTAASPVGRTSTAKLEN